MKIFSSTNINPIARMNDTEPSGLLSACIAGDEAAIESLLRQYETGVFRLALSIVGDRAEASEITQETFIAVLRSLKSYQEKKSFKAWLYTIALNYSRSHLRKRNVLERLNTALTTVFQVDTQKPSSPEEAIIQDEKEAALWNELNKLDERHRTVVILRYFQDMTIAEISETLKVNEGTIHSRLYTARERLKSALQGFQGESFDAN